VAQYVRLSPYTYTQLIRIDKSGFHFFHRTHFSEGTMQQDELLTAAKLARRINSTYWFAKRLMRSGALPTVGAGRRIRISSRVVEQMLNGQLGRAEEKEETAA
jgi:hypothetical protein